MDIGLLRPATLPQVITEVAKVLNIVLLIPYTFPHVISEVVDVGTFRPATLPLVFAGDMLV